MKITRGYIEQVTVECPMEEAVEARKWVDENGFNIIWCGPKIVDGTRDFKVFQIIAGKDLPVQPSNS